MWVFLSDAFLSIVVDRDDPSLRLVRARFPGDIERAFPGVEVTETPHADYRYRAWLPLDEVADRLADQVMDMGYPNFKGSVSEPPRQRAYADVWGVMLDHQERAHEDPGRG